MALKKVMIISYFFPPCNLTPSQRAISWAMYFKKFGYYPIIISRKWEQKMVTMSDMSRPTSDGIKHEVHDGYEVYYLPFKSSLRDRIYVQYGDNRFSIIRRALTLLELLVQHIFTSIIGYSNIFSFAEELAAKDPEIKKALITVNPNNLLKIGYRLNKRFGIKWIADYRDAWTTTSVRWSDRTWLTKFIAAIDSYFEKKWVSTASYITAVSLPIAQGVSNLTGVPCSELFNGFIKEDFDGLNGEKYDDFTITYVGTLYSYQKVEIFCDAFKRLVDETPGIKATLYFPGLAFYQNQQTERVTELMIGYEENLKITQRMEREKVLEIEKRSHLLFHVAWDEHAGIIASKIYEYLASGTFILVVPTDNGSIQQIIDESGCGICLSTVEETYAFIKQEYNNYLKGIYRINDTDKPEIMQFSRESQAKHVTELLDKI